MTKYYKVVKSLDQENSNSKIKSLKTGLNIIDKDTFDTDENFTCYPLESGGIFWFTTKKFIPNYLHKGIYLVEVTLPEEDKELIVVKSNDTFIAAQKIDLYKANKIIIGEKYSLFDLDTYQKFGINIQDNRTLLFRALQYNRLDIFNYWLDSKFKLHFIDRIIFNASFYNHFDVL